MELGKWEVTSLDHSDTKWGLTRSFINKDGRYENQNYHIKFTSQSHAEAAAKLANMAGVLTNMFEVPNDKR